MAKGKRHQSNRTEDTADSQPGEASRSLTADSLGFETVEDLAEDITSDSTDTPLDRAAKIVAGACAASSNLVKVISFEPDLITVPPQLFLFSFKAVAISDDNHLRVFRQFLIRLMPNKFAPFLQPDKLPLGPDVIIGPVVHYVEALIRKLGF